MRREHKKIEFDMMMHRYHSSSGVNKGKILTELCDLYGYNRKYLLQVFNCLTGKKHIRKGRNGLLKSELNYKTKYSNKIFL